MRKNISIRAQYIIIIEHSDRKKIRVHCHHTYFSQKWIWYLQNRLALFCERHTIKYGDMKYCILHIKIARFYISNLGNRKYMFLLLPRKYLDIFCVGLCCEIITCPKHVGSTNPSIAIESPPTKESLIFHLRLNPMASNSYISTNLDDMILYINIPIYGILLFKDFDKLKDMSAYTESSKKPWHNVIINFSLHHWFHSMQKRSEKKFWNKEYWNDLEEKERNTRFRIRII